MKPIRYVTSADIDKHKWDSCIHFASNSRVYGYTWYLNQICEEWDALVEGNYESVFPIIWNDKIPGFRQLHHPLLAQQLGLFSVHALSNTRVAAFLDAIPSKFKRQTINLTSNIAFGGHKEYTQEQRTNYILMLDQSYDNIRSGYSTNLKRNLKKADRNELYGGASMTPEQFVDLFKSSHTGKIDVLSDKVGYTMLRIIYQAMHRGLGYISTVTTKERDICAAAFFLINKGRLTYLLPVTTAEGKKLGAMHFLLDVVIRKNAQSPNLIDFEGSSIESIARFYKAFGAVDQPYSVIKKNQLPFWLKWIID